MEKLTNPVEAPGVSRRRFLGYAGAFAGAGMLTLQACKNDDDIVTPTNNSVDLGRDDTGILNYAYALEQLEAAFYIQVIERMGTGVLVGEEVDRFIEIRDHEIAHREFFRRALGTSGIRADLEVDFSTIDFGNRASVLGTAKTFEDLGVSAYNGAGQLLTSAEYLLVAGKIVSVEARHAAYIRELVGLNSFATDVVDSRGMEIHKTPAQVLAAAQTYIKQTINGNNLPTS